MDTGTKMYLIYFLASIEPSLQKTLTKMFWADARAMTPSFPVYDSVKLGGYRRES